jgi:hypothetical protein
MKNMKPVQLRLAEPLTDGYRLRPVSDEWSELLPDRIPLRFSIFRCASLALRLCVARAAGRRAHHPSLSCS